ncbi:MAG: hypothetical protein QOJ54_757 [Aliidongia sp.]|nr:hypothetical protein [Aliidongia sp.]
MLDEDGHYAYAVALRSDVRPLMALDKYTGLPYIELWTLSSTMLRTQPTFPNTASRWPLARWYSQIPSVKLLMTGEITASTG